VPKVPLETQVPKELQVHKVRFKVLKERLVLLVEQVIQVHKVQYKEPKVR
jgi:hypothetical protein